MKLEVDNLEHTLDKLRENLDKKRKVRALGLEIFVSNSHMAGLLSHALFIHPHTKY